MKKLLFFVVFFVSVFHLNAQSWESLPGGSLDGPPNTIISFGGYRWVSGSFYHAGSLSSEFVARHDGVGWIPTPALSNPAHSFCIWNNTLYAVGSFEIATTTYGVAKWNGVGWEYFGVIPSGFYFHTATIFNNEMIFGGRVLLVDGISINHLVKWNGSTWTSFPFPISCSWAVLPEVSTLEVFNNFLYVGGVFSSVNSASTVLAFKTDWLSLTPLSLDPNYGVTDFISYHDSVFCSGSFISGPFPVNQVSPGIVKTENAAWHQVGHGLKLKANSLARHTADLYVGGSYINWCFNSPCNHADVGNLGRWDGISWSNQSAGLFNQGSENINFLYSDTVNNTIYAAGDFQINRGDIADFIAIRRSPPLSVTFHSLSGRVIENNIMELNWRDETPEDGITFDVQVSIDEENFSSIGKVSELSTKKDYSFRYQIKECGKYFFRLSFEKKYSNIIFSEIACGTTSVQQLGRLLLIKPTGQGNMDIFNQVGQKVKSLSILDGQTIKLFDLPPGLYVFRFTGSKRGLPIVRKIILW